MTNMSYCRFENTMKDLQDCYEHMDDEGLSEDEEAFRKDLINLCLKIVNEH